MSNISKQDSNVAGLAQQNRASQPLHLCFFHERIGPISASLALQAAWHFPHVPASFITVLRTNLVLFGTAYSAMQRRNRREPLEQSSLKLSLRNAMPTCIYHCQHRFTCSYSREPSTLAHTHSLSYIFALLQHRQTQAYSLSHGHPRLHEGKLVEVFGDIDSPHGALQQSQKTKSEATQERTKATDAIHGNRSAMFDAQPPSERSVSSLR